MQSNAAPFWLVFESVKNEEEDPSKIFVIFKGGGKI